MKICAFTIADEKNLVYANKMIKSLRKFHSEKELPMFVIGPEKLKEILPQDPMFFYRATPIIAKDLWKQGYDTIVKIDADSVITSRLDHLWDGEFDVGVVNNANPREMKAYPVSVWNIHPLSYVNCGLVVMKSERFINHWLNLCNSVHFQAYQMKEQDLLNIMVFYMDFKVAFLDSGDKWNGLISKGYWLKFKLDKDKLILPKNEEWPTTEDKQICVIHVAGGNVADKFNFNIQFKPEIAKWLTNLTK
jgi:hypothetical protein